MAVILAGELTKMEATMLHTSQGPFCSLCFLVTRGSELNNLHMQNCEEVFLSETALYIKRKSPKRFSFLSGVREKERRGEESEERRGKCTFSLVFPRQGFSL